MLVYFVTNLLVLYGSRIREYYADEGSVRLGNPPYQLASGLYKLVYASSRMHLNIREKDELHKMEGVKALFLNDISRSWKEVRELKELDTLSNGTVDLNEFYALKFKEVKLGASEKMLEIFTTHPNILKRMKQLAALA